jgi:hypothetical protein
MTVTRSLLPALPDLVLAVLGCASPVAVDVTLRAGTRRRAVIAAATERQPAAIWAATPADDAEPMHKPGSVIAFTPALNGAGWMAAGFIPGKTFEWDKS